VAKGKPQLTFWHNPLQYKGPVPHAIRGLFFEASLLYNTAVNNGCDQPLLAEPVPMAFTCNHISVAWGRPSTTNVRLLLYSPFFQEAPITYGNWVNTCGNWLMLGSKAGLLGDMGSRN